MNYRIHTERLGARSMLERKPNEAVDGYFSTKAEALEDYEKHKAEAQKLIRRGEADFPSRRKNPRPGADYFACESETGHLVVCVEVGGYWFRGAKKFAPEPSYYSRAAELNRNGGFAPTTLEQARLLRQY